MLLLFCGRLVVGADLAIVRTTETCRQNEQKKQEQKLIFHIDTLPLVDDTRHPRPDRLPVAAISMLKTKSGVWRVYI
jgi:hypothetical protein